MKAALQTSCSTAREKREIALALGCLAGGVLAATGISLPHRAHVFFFFFFANGCYMYLYINMHHEERRDMSAICIWHENKA